MVRTDPYATLECWIDPDSVAVEYGIGSDTEPYVLSAIERIGKKLREQYETISMRVRYRLLLDPTNTELEKYCKSQRRIAKTDRVLFHYNGHGVPKATKNGEIWSFNRTFTQYIPVPMDKLMEWLGAPTIYVWDCAAAGNLVETFKILAERRDAESANTENQTTPPPIPFRSSFHFAACQANEVLPANPELPADLFTSCLTSPIETALHVFALQNPFLCPFSPEDARKLPGKHSDRMTPKGYLSWVFKSVTDAIAWSVLPVPAFRKLFRTDTVIACLFRGFLLADRLMRLYNCHPISAPELPVTHDHPMWNTWDLAIDQCLSHLPRLLEEEGKRKKEKGEVAGEDVRSLDEDAVKRTEPHTEPHTDEPLISASFPRYSTFFEEQLTAFEVWLDTASYTREIPLQLPIILQCFRILPSLSYDLFSFSKSGTPAFRPFIIDTLPRPGSVGRPSRTFSRHPAIPMQMYSLPGPRNQSILGLHLVSNPGRRKVLSKRFAHA